MFEIKGYREQVRGHVTLAVDAVSVVARPASTRETPFKVHALGVDVAVVLARGALVHVWERGKQSAP